MKIDKEWIKKNFAEWICENAYVEDWEELLSSKEAYVIGALAVSIDDYFARNNEEVDFQECKFIAREMIDNGDIFVADLIATAFKEAYPNLYEHISTCEQPYK